MINSWVAEGENWRLEGEDEPVVKFWGATVELRLNWLDCLTFSDGDAYTWTKVHRPGSGLMCIVNSDHWRSFPYHAVTFLHDTHFNCMPTCPGSLG